MIPSSDELRYFLETAKTENMSRAAERLGISQPSLTLGIQRLEQAVGLELFTRSKRGVTLTMAGKQVVNHAREMLQKWEDIKANAFASQTEIRGVITLGCHPSVAKYTLPVFLPDFLNKNGNVEIKLKHDLSRRVVDAVIRSEIDLAIAVNPVRHPDLIIKKIFEDEVRFWSVASCQNPETLIGDPDLVQVQHLLKRLGPKRRNFSRFITSSSLEVIASLTRSGAGVGILPKRVLGHERSPYENIRTVPGLPIYTDEICIVYRTENRKLRVIQALAEELSQLKFS